jgi:hypothetical protein
MTLGSSAMFPNVETTPFALAVRRVDSGLWLLRNGGGEPGHAGSCQRTDNDGEKLPTLAASNRILWKVSAMPGKRN